jgi:putative endonuclease
MSPAPTSRTSRGRTGIAAEALARRHLELAGWTILDSNVVVGRGELDLLALDPYAPGTLVVVEVRGSRTRRFGAPEESLDHRKLARLRAAALALLRSGWPRDHGLRAVRAIRLDVVAVDLDPMIGPGAGGPSIRHVRGVTP